MTASAPEVLVAARELVRWNNEHDNSAAAARGNAQHAERTPEAARFWNAREQQCLRLRDHAAAMVAACEKELAAALAAHGVTVDPL